MKKVKIFFLLIVFLCPFFNIVRVVDNSMKNTLWSGDVVLVLKKNLEICGLNFNIFNIKNRDVLIFKRFDSINTENRSNYYVKRCIGIPNNLIQLFNDELIINNKKEKLNESTILKQNSNNDNSVDIFRKEFVKDSVNLNKLLIFSGSIKKINDPSLHMNVSETNNFWIPAKASSIPRYLTMHSNHKQLIRLYEKQEGYQKINRNHKFKNNYYYMVGDNRTASSDSRKWGCIPENDIKGKVLLVLYSIKGRYNGRYKFQKKRIFKLVK